MRLTVRSQSFTSTKSEPGVHSPILRAVRCAVSFRLDRSITPREVAHVFRRHQKKMFVWAMLVMVVSLAAMKFLPRKYASEAKLFVRLGRESVTLDPTTTTGQMLQVQETRENQINSA